MWSERKSRYAGFEGWPHNNGRHVTEVDVLPLPEIIFPSRRSPHVCTSGLLPFLEAFTVTILEVRGNKIRLGIETPKEIPVVRAEWIDTGRLTMIAVWFFDKLLVLELTVSLEVLFCVGWAVLGLPKAFFSHKTPKLTKIDSPGACLAW